MHNIYSVLDKEALYPYGKNKAGNGAGQKGGAILSRLVREFHTERVHLSENWSGERVESCRMFGGDYSRQRE